MFYTRRLKYKCVYCHRRESLSLGRSAFFRNATQWGATLHSKGGANAASNLILFKCVARCSFVKSNMRRDGCIHHFWPAPAHSYHSGDIIFCSSCVPASARWIEQRIVFGNHKELPLCAERSGDTHTEARTLSIRMHRLLAYLFYIINQSLHCHF